MSEEMKSAGNVFWPVFFAIVLAACVCKIVPTFVGALDTTGNFRNAVLIVKFSEDPNMDDVLLNNVIMHGGFLEMSASSEYVDFLRKHYPKFDCAAAANKDGQFAVIPAIFNWISSKGWKFQQKFCINLNDQNAEYYFVR